MKSPGFNSVHTGEDEEEVTTSQKSQKKFQ
jgi:hypothetical protein